MRIWKLQAVLSFIIITPFHSLFLQLSNRTIASLLHFSSCRLPFAVGALLLEDIYDIYISLSSYYVSLKVSEKAAYQHEVHSAKKR